MGSLFARSLSVLPAMTGRNSSAATSVSLTRPRTSAGAFSGGTKNGRRLISPGNQSDRIWISPAMGAAVADSSPNVPPSFLRSRRLAAIPVPAEASGAAIFSVSRSLSRVHSRRAGVACATASSSRYAGATGNHRPMHNDNPMRRPSLLFEVAHRKPHFDEMLK